MIVYKMNLYALLKECGYSVVRLKDNGLLYDSQVERLKKGAPVSFATLDTVCRLCNKQPADLIDVKITPEDIERFHISPEEDINL